MLLFKRSPYWEETSETKSVTYGFGSFGWEQLQHRFDQVYQGPTNSEYFCEYCDISAVVSVPADTRWIKANVNMTGFYRVHYDKNNWEQLSEQLMRDHTVSVLSTHVAHSTVVDSGFSTGGCQPRGGSGWGGGGYQLPMRPLGSTSAHCKRVYVILLCTSNLIMFLFMEMDTTQTYKLFQNT